jgi:hypothetical protein
MNVSAVNASGTIKTASVGGGLFFVGDIAAG